MIDLHLHLDGSLEPEFLHSLASQQHMDLSVEDIKKQVICTSCNSLNEYLGCFDLPIKLLQTEDSLMQATFHLMERLEKEKMAYAEIRFAPQLHTRLGLSIENVVNAVLLALNEANRVFSVKAQVILCCMRGGVENKLQNIETIEVGRKYLGKGVCAIDLAGAEALYKTQDFKYLFEIAKGVGMPFVIHAGEADGVESVSSAINFGASRIGHGIALRNEEYLMNEVKEKQIAIEMCPTSNLQTKAIKNIKDFPLFEFLDNNLLATINTDNMTVSNTTINKEFELLENKLGVNNEIRKKLICNSVRSAFLTEADKTKLMLKVLNQRK